MNNKTHNDAAGFMKIGMKSYLFPRYKEFRKKTIEIAAIQPYDMILDFGCGIGLLEEYLETDLSDNYKVIGVDIGPDLINIAKERLNTGILISTENDLAHFGNFKIVQKSA
jgi:ubiquinone/menaquinone biosynthesis C-methylase UbiE